MKLAVKPYLFDNTSTDVLSAVWGERNHQRQYRGEHRAGATQHLSAVPRI